MTLRRTHVAAFFNARTRFTTIPAVGYVNSFIPCLWFDRGIERKELVKFQPICDAIVGKLVERQK